MISLVSGELLINFVAPSVSAKACMELALVSCSIARCHIQAKIITCDLLLYVCGTWYYGYVLGLRDQKIGDYKSLLNYQERSTQTAEYPLIKEYALDDIGIPLSLVKGTGLFG